MRILLLTSRLPYPPYRGDKLKIFNLLKRLGRKHRITLLSFIQDEDEKRFLPELDPYCERVRLLRRSPRKSWLSCVGGLFSSDPLQVSYFRSDRMKAELEKLLAEEDFDLVHVHLIRMAQYQPSLRGLPTLLDLMDAVSDYLKSSLALIRNPLKRLLTHVDWRRMQRYEQTLADFDTCLVCSTKDQLSLQRSVPDAVVDVTVNGVDLETFRPVDVEREPDSIIYTGNMTYQPNVDGAVYLCKEILPLVAERVPGVHLYLVGQKPPRAIQKLAADPRVTVTGFVEDLNEWYAKCMVSVCPIRMGAGTLNKVLEPMATGTPVVSTTFGVAGLGVTDEREVLLADDPPEFAAAVARLLREPDTRKRIAANARQHILANHDWESIAARYDRLYSQLAASPLSLAPQPRMATTTVPSSRPALLGT